MKKTVIILSGLLFLCGCGSSSKPIAVSLMPTAQTSIDQGQTLSFAASVTNDSKKAGVTWSMSGTNCTGSACGTFTGGTTTSAAYNAPASVSAKMTVTIVATSITDTTKSMSSTIVVNSAPTISTTSLAGGTVGTAYSSTLTDTGGSGTLTWALATGSSLPAGLSLSNSGTISGTPTAAGTTNFTVKVTDSSGGQQGPVSAAQQFSLTIKPAQLAITTTALSNGVVGATYSASLAATGGTGSVSWSVTTGSLPAGLSLSGSTISGTPTAAGTSAFTVTATDSGTPAQTANQSLSIAINPKLAITTTTLANGVVGTAYSASLASSGGVGTVTWTVATGTLPAGLTLSTAGAISGTPTTAGTTSFAVQAKDSGTPQQTTQQALSVTIYAGLTITTTSLQNGAVNSMYSATLTSAGGTGTVTWSVSQGTLPAGLNLSSAGVISGTPTASGISNFTVSATDSSTPPQTKTQALSLTINPALSITTTTLPASTLGTAYRQNIQTSGGTLPITWSVTSGSLPAGLTLAGNAMGVGMVSGTPTATGTSTFTVTAKDSSTPAVSVNQQFTLVINVPPLSITTITLPNASVNTAYSASLQASGGTPPYTWTAATGSTLPSWLTLSGSGTNWSLAGTPTAIGTASFSLTVTDSSTPQLSQTQALGLTINAAAACSDSGSESLLAGQYAFILGGYTESGFLAAIGSFTADGTGKIIAGTIDSNGTIVQSAAAMDTTKSFYNVGSNYLGCATLVTSGGTFTTRISVGSISGTVATEGRMVEWDDATNTNYLTATGQFFLQSIPAIIPNGKYTYALGGVYGSSHEYRAGVVGVVALQAGSSGGTITTGEYDINVEGTINDGNGTATPYSGMTGSYTALDPTTGRFTDTATIGSETDHHVAYALSSSQYLQMSTDALSENTAILVGKAQAHSGDQTLPVGTNLVYYATGTSSAEIGIINITNTNSYSATYYEDVSGTAEPTQNPTCTFTIDPYARVTTSGATCTMYLTNYSKMYPPVFYFYDSSYGVMLGTGAGVYIGSVEPQTAPSGGFSPGSLAGTYYAGDNEVVNEGVSAEMIGVEALTFDGAGNVNTVGDYIGGYIGTSVSQETDQPQTVSLGTMNTNGTFSTNSAYGQINAMMISPTKVVNIDNATQPDPIIQIIKPVSPEI